MVKVKEANYYLPDGRIHIEGWLSTLADKYSEPHQHFIRMACYFAQDTAGQHLTATGQSCLNHGMMMAEILADLKADEQSIAAALLYNNVECADLPLEDVAEHVNPEVAKLIAGTQQMDAIHNLPIYLHHQPQSRGQIDNIRKMLLAIVEDVRVVLIKLAERLCMLRLADTLPATIQESLAHEIQEIYAPLANRLGIGQIKWELEDLAFKYLNSQAYKELAKKLDLTRIEREHYVTEIKATLSAELMKADIKEYDIAGRAKHIYSIYRKMVRKGVDYGQIYDAIALRILVSNLEECYTCLGIVHTLWQPIPEEFDDYISHPKPNGYRSIHTAVVGPGNINFEVQIRTKQMHQDSELGVAAHWKYKEGAAPQQGYEEKILWLRQVLDWQNELVQQGKSVEQTTTKQIFGDRVYVFTPENEIVDLPNGSTPLDFAYQIHTQIGHRCRGAKVNGQIVPLTHRLITGEKIEIITTKIPRPSRDWLSPHAGYLFTSRARAKVLHWFKEQDHDQYVSQGQAILDAELSKLNLPKIDFAPYIQHYNLKSYNDLLAAIARGDLKLHTLLNMIQHALGIKTEKVKPVVIAAPSKLSTSSSKNDVIIEGLDDILITFAKCCKPIPGDLVVGHITKERGVTIHLITCPNIDNVANKNKLLEAHWVGQTRHHYPADLVITAHDREDLLRDITTLISNKKLKLVGLHTFTERGGDTVTIKLTLEINEASQLTQIIAQLSHIHHIVGIRRC